METKFTILEYKFGKQKYKWVTMQTIFLHLLV